jgi:SAM-dependent methyltransferase
MRRSAVVLLAGVLATAIVMFFVAVPAESGGDISDPATKKERTVQRAASLAATVVASCSAAALPAPRRDCITAGLLAPLADSPAIEIGGPSQAYNGKPYSVYSHLRRCDNVRFSEKTLWEKQTGSVYSWIKGKPAGRQYILDASNLSEIATATYNVVMSAHNLEHLANPLKALLEQKRILRPLGVLLLTVPNKRMTFDHRRPTATLQHLLDDLARDTPESDLSHLEEILRLHDLQRDRQAGDLNRFRKRSMNNFQNRGLHQHVFDEVLVREMLQHLGFTVVFTDVSDIHIFTAAIRSEDA